MKAKIDNGKVAEYRFASEALARGMVPTWPSTETGSWDMILWNEKRAFRVQIKSTTQTGDRLAITLKTRSNGKRRKYSKADTDYIVIYLVLFDLWYILPISKIKKYSIGIQPDSPSCKWNTYKSAWHLLE